MSAEVVCKKVEKKNVGKRGTEYKVASNESRGQGDGMK